MKNIFIIFLLWLFGMFSYFSYWDALDDVLWQDSDSSDYQIVNDKLDNWTVKDTVKNTTQLMLKISIIVWMAVFLFWGIRFMLSMWDDSKAKKVRDGLIVSGVWLIIAFWAWVILQLIISAWTDLQVWNEFKF